VTCLSSTDVLFSNVLRSDSGLLFLFYAMFFFYVIVIVKSQLALTILRLDMSYCKQLGNMLTVFVCF